MGQRNEAFRGTHMTEFWFYDPGTGSASFNLSLLPGDSDSGALGLGWDDGLCRANYCILDEHHAIKSDGGPQFILGARTEGWHMGALGFEHNFEGGEHSLTACVDGHCEVALTFKDFSRICFYQVSSSVQIDDIKSFYTGNRD